MIHMVVSNISLSPHFLLPLYHIDKLLSSGYLTRRRATNIFLSLVEKTIKTTTDNKCQKYQDKILSKLNIHLSQLSTVSLPHSENFVKWLLSGTVGFEPTASGLTGRRDNHLHHAPIMEDYFLPSSFRDNHCPMHSTFGVARYCTQEDIFS